MFKDRNKPKDSTPTIKESSLLAENSFVIIGILMTLGLAFIILFSVNEGSNWGHILAVVSLVMLASFAVGAILGFIFGIPRTLQGDGDSSARTGQDEGTNGAGSEISAQVKANTNLEQLSDWLTKIIVGVGLVEFKEIASGIAGLSERLADGIMDPRFGFTIISSTIVFYLLMGFLVCYLWTRIYFEKILKSQIDNTRLNKLEQAKDLQKEVADLNLEESFQVDKAKEVIQRMIKKKGDSKELTSYFQEVILIAFDKYEYLAINTLVNEFDQQIQISAKTWADVAIANMNLYYTTHNIEYYKKSFKACDRSVQVSNYYGVPHMIKIYLELITWKIARANNNDVQMKNVRQSIEAIVDDIKSRNLVTSYDAFNYFTVNKNWEDYNKIFETEFETEYNIIHQRYKEYTELQPSE